MNTLEIIGTAVGLIYLWLEYRASIYLWIVGIIMPAIYIVVYYRAGLYADFGINIYYLLAALYGYAFWRWGGKRKDSGNTADVPIAPMPLRYYIPLAGILVACLLAIAWVLINFTDSTVPWLDSFTTSLSIVAMWMLSRKYIEQWIAWIAVDAVCTGLFIYKQLYFTSALYALYTIIAIFGYLKWKRTMTLQ